MKEEGREVVGIEEEWQAWKLADDPSTYGENAGRFVIVTADGEHEQPLGIMDEEDALAVVAAHNAIRREA